VLVDDGGDRRGEERQRDAQAEHGERREQARPALGYLCFGRGKRHRINIHIPGYHPREPVVTFLSCCLQGLEETRSYNADAAHLTLAAIVLAGIGTLASGAVAAWRRVR
jgi:hypothetical protein